MISVPTTRLRCLAALVGAGMAAGCRTTVKPTQAATAPPAASTSPAGPGSIRMDGKTLSFRRPGSDDLFTLHLGDELDHDTGGITEVPRSVGPAARDATSSYYVPTNQDGGEYAAAESSYTRDMADRVARRTVIQYQPDFRRLLITEDKGDGVPVQRYILFTGYPKGGYRVTYLNPGTIKVPGASPLDTFPATVRLLPGDRADVEGKTLKIDDIPQSTHPFSVGF